MRQVVYVFHQLTFYQFPSMQILYYQISLLYMILKIKELDGLNITVSILNRSITFTYCLVS